jgi:hypothetical protein
LRINILKIGNYKLIKKEYFSDNIFRFKLNIKSEDLNKFNQILILELKQTITADWYYTNGQNIVFLSKNKNNWRGVHFEDIYAFSDFLAALDITNKRGFKPLKSYEYKTFKTAHLRIIYELNNLKMQSLPFDNDYEVMVQNIYPSSKKVYFPNGEVAIYDSINFEKLTHKMESHLKPHKLKTCFNCKHFMYTGLTISFFKRREGYCRLLLNYSDRQLRHYMKTHIWLWCTDFISK